MPKRLTSMKSATRAPCLATLFTAMSLTASTASDYVIMPGDVLQIDITGMSGMQHRLPVAIDGTIRLPLAGPVAVAGQNIHDIGALIQSRLASRTMRQATSNGEEFLVIIDSERVLVSIAEYRPVYLNGEVTSAGEQNYRPGMTVRQAIALAGGYRRTERTLTDMIVQAADYRAEQMRLWTDLAHASMKVTRITSELEGATTAPAFTFEGSPLSKETLDELAKVETEIFNVNRAIQNKETAFLRSEIETTQSQLATIKEQQEQEHEGLEADNAELQRHTDMEQRGITTSSRVAESRRNLLMSSTRYLQATVQIAQFGRDEASLIRRQQELEDARRTDLLAQLQQAVVQVASLTEQVKSAAEKLQYASVLNGMRTEEPGATPTVIVIRNDEAGPQRLAADQDMPLMPGDVVEVSLPAVKSGLGRLLQN